MSFAAPGERGFFKRTSTPHVALREVFSPSRAKYRVCPDCADQRRLGRGEHERLAKRTATRCQRCHCRAIATHGSRVRNARGQFTRIVQIPRVMTTIDDVSASRNISLTHSGRMTRDRHIHHGNHRLAAGQRNPPDVRQAPPTVHRFGEMIVTCWVSLFVMDSKAHARVFDPCGTISIQIVASLAVSGNDSMPPNAA